MERFFGEFTSLEDVENEWAGKGVLSGAVVIAAIYTQESYEGYANCVFRKDGKLYEVHCSHCSCNGLDSWEPEETTYQALVDRLEKTRSYQVNLLGDDYTSALMRGLLDDMFDEEVLENK